MALCSCKTLTPEQQAAKEIKEALQEKADSMKFTFADKSLTDMDFVLEAGSLVFKNGTRAYVNSSTNYIAVSGDKAVVQVAPYNSGGPNGIGGVTVEGTPSHFKIKTDKKGNRQASFSVTGINISATVSITLIKDSNRAIALVNPNFNSNSITLDGSIVAPSNSSVIQGREIGRAHV